MQVGGSQRVLVLVDHMHVDCSLLPQGVLHLVLHVMGDRRLEDHVVTIHNHHYHRHHHHHENRWPGRTRGRSGWLWRGRPRCFGGQPT